MRTGCGPYPLETYYSDARYWPFQELSTGNYRGFRATWEMVDQKLFLTEIDIDTDKVPLDVIFGKNAENGRVLASWYSGVVLIRHKPVSYGEDGYWKSDYDKFIYIQFQQGSAVKTCVLSSAEINKRPLQNEDARNLEQLFLEKTPDIDANNRPPMGPEDISRLEAAKIYIKDIYDRHLAQIKAEREQARIAMEEKCRSIYSRMKGYESIPKHFIIKESSLGYMSTYPDFAYGLIVDLESTEDSLIKSVRWHVPVKDDVSQYDWDDLYDGYQETVSVISNHRWIKEWLASETGRYLEISINGRTPMDEFQSGIFLVAPWKHARLKGLPYYEVNLHEPHCCRGTVLFGREDPRALIVTLRPRDGTSSSQHVYDEPNHDNSEQKGVHWLDQFDFSYHPTQTIPEYIVVDPDGHWAINHNKK